MRQHRQEVEFGRLLRSFVEERAQRLGHLRQLGEALLFRVHRRLGRVDIGDRDIGPVGELAPVVPRIIEQGREHHRGQLDRHSLNPVEGLVARQPVEDLGGPLANQPFHVGEVCRRDDRADHLALVVVAGRIHADEARPVHVLGLILDLDAAQFRGRGIDLVVDLDLHDVFVLGHRPIGAVAAIAAVMHRVLAPQPGEIGVPDVILVEPRIADVDGVERHAAGVGMNRGVEGCVHRSASRCCGFNVGLPASGR